MNSEDPTISGAGSFGRSHRAMHFQRADVVGRYHILEIVGEGGFGVVYRAEQREGVQRHVALKVIKPGMDSAAVVARFEQERQALAVIDHPNVAKVYDGGVTGPEQGRLPWFAMEFVKGEPITTFCDRERLSIRDRLELFVQVCEAVQHAHTKMIIHRDIKPSNILVRYGEAGNPEVKVIDFGVAKALNQRLSEHSIFTEMGQLIGTPEYMSPEQAEMSGLDIDARTDVYSLGVVLYELVTGLLPFDPGTLRAAAFGEIQRIIRDVEAPRPSTRLSSVGDRMSKIAERRRADVRALSSVLKGELDWVVMKCLEKERGRRYETTNALAMELCRYLNGEPVLARPASAGYRMAKFVKRRKGPVAAGLAIVFLLIGGLVGVSLAFAEAQNQREAAIQNERRAEHEAERARSAEAEVQQRAEELQLAIDFQLQMLSQIDTRQAGIDLMRDIRDRFADALHRAGVPEEVRLQRVEAFRNELLQVNYTDTAGAMIDRTFLSPAINAIDEQFKDQPIVDAQLRQAFSSMYWGIGLYDKALPLQESALTTRRRVFGNNHPHTLTSIINMASLLDAQGKPQKAEPYIREVVEYLRRVRGDEDPNTLFYIRNLGSVLKRLGKHQDAIDLLDPAIPIARSVFTGADAPHLATILETSAIARMNLPFDTDRFKIAESDLLEAHAILIQTRFKTHGTIQSVADLFDRWHQAEPDAGHDAKAAEWRAKLKQTQTVTESDDDAATEQ